MCVPQINIESLPLTEYITVELDGIGVPRRLKGYRYIITAAELAIMNPSHMRNMMKALYVLVAELHNTDVVNVERSIRYAVEQTFIYGDLSRINEVFTNSIDADKGKVTNKAFIKRVAQLVASKYLY